MKKILEWIIKQEMQFLNDYPKLALPLSEEFNLDISCAQSIVDSVIEWEKDSNTIYSLEELLNRRFPDVVTN